jgi:hypothetical protein
MNGRTRKLGLAGVLVGGTLLFGVGFAGAQTSSDDTQPKPAVEKDTTYVGVHSGSGGGCGDGGAATADPAQF